MLLFKESNTASLFFKVTLATLLTTRTCPFNSNLLLTIIINDELPFFISTYLKTHFVIMYMTPQAPDSLNYTPGKKNLKAHNSGTVSN